MSLDLGTLRAYLDLDGTSWDTAFAKAQDKAQKFGGGVPTWMGVASAAVIGAGIAAATGLYQLGAAWDDVEDTIRIGTGATGDDLQGLVDVAKEVAKNVPVDIASIGPAVADLNTRLGLTGPALQQVAEQILEAGRMLGEDVDINSATGAFNAFGIESDAVSGKLDYLWGVSQATGIGMNDLTSRLASAAPITQQLGFSFEETAGMIGAMDKAGLDSQTMIGAMQKGLAGMTTPGEDASATFQRVVGEIQGFIDTGDDAAARDLASQLFGTRGAAQFVGALSSGAINMADLANVAGMTGDTIMEASADTADFAEKWQLVQNKASAALEPLASTVFSALAGALDAVMPALTLFTGWLAENPAMLQVIAAVIGILALAFVGLTIATWAMNTALLANPITWIVLAVIALIAAVVLLVMNWDAVVAFVSEIWAGFIDWIVGVIDGFVGWWTGVWEGFAGWITGVWEGFVGFVSDVWQGFVDWIMAVIIGYVSFWIGVWTSIASFFTDVWNNIVAFVTGVWQGYINWLMSVILGFVSFWSGVWEGVSSFFRSMWEGVSRAASDIWNGVISFLTGIPGKILGVFTGAGQWLYDIGSDILQGLWDGLESIWNNLVSWIEDIGSTIADTFAGVLGIHSPSRVFREFGINTLQGYVQGLDAMQPSLDRRMTNLVRTPEMELVGAGAPSKSSSSSGAPYAFTYVAAEGQSLSSEEALFEALSSPRAKGPGE